ncbi:peptidylprolyl isomerase [Rosettibacter firmus]|uniref:peptidylprolyl isomerase n=1 Tax=Rosettibacter firmus TaxID=3111522 RepID=UPI00336C2D77
MKIISNRLKFSCFIFFLLLIHSISFCQKVNIENEIIARVQNTPITKKEFIERFEFSPHAQTETAFDTSTMKKEFLYTLIAEKLLAQNALKEKLDKTEEFEYLMQYLQNIYLRDALYKKEIKDKVVITDSSFSVGKNKMLKTLKIKFIFSVDENEIKDIYSSLQKGAQFDSILSLRPENLEQLNYAEVSFGNLAPEIEEQIFDLLPGEFTKPVKLKEGWYICKVYDVTLKSELTSKDISKIKKIIEERAENKLYEEFYNKFFKGVVVNVDRQLFDKLIKHILEFINNNQKYFSEQKNNKLRFAEVEFNQIQKFFSEEELNLPFIKFDISPVTLKTFLKYSGYTGIEFDSPEKSKIQKRLNAYISNFIRNELYSREAKKRGYDKLPEVSEELQMWRDYYLSRAMMKSIFKNQNVSDKEAEEFYLKMNRTINYPDSVNIAEITSISLDTIENIFDELKTGSTFEELQKKYRSEKFTGLKPINELGEIGKIAADMKIGDIYGPIKTQEGYSIIKILDKKEGQRKRIENFEEAKDDIKNIIQTKKMYQELDKVTAKLAIENGVEINESALKSIKVSNINMLVFRRFGFGGQLIAVPYAPIYSSWFKVYQQLRKELTF